jgi:putative oxidoreductase
MKWLALVLRVLVGLPFAALGIMYFVVDMPTPEGLPDSAKDIMKGMGPTKWLTVVKVLEVVGGLMLLGGRFVPLGLVILVPVTVNIALWDVLVMRYQSPPLGSILLIFEIGLIGCYWPTFAPFFRAKAPLYGASA